MKKDLNFNTMLVSLIGDNGLGVYVVEEAILRSKSKALETTLKIASLIAYKPCCASSTVEPLIVNAITDPFINS